MDKYVKARKTHECDECHRRIEVGHVYHYGEYREPRYEEISGSIYESVQCGIRYVKYRLCLHCDDLLSNEPSVGQGRVAPTSAG